MKAQDCIAENLGKVPFVTWPLSSDSHDWKANASLEESSADNNKYLKETTKENPSLKSI
jgi:hypothetical protein